MEPLNDDMTVICISTTTKYGQMSSLHFQNHDGLINMAVQVRCTLQIKWINNPSAVAVKTFDYTSLADIEKKA